MIRVCNRDPSQESHPFIDMRALQRPTKFKVRVYVLRATNLQPQDKNGLADPYLHVEIKGSTGRKHKVCCRRLDQSPSGCCFARSLYLSIYLSIYLLLCC
jgi:hypothetical protein